MFNKDTAYLVIDGTYEMSSGKITMDYSGSGDVKYDTGAGEAEENNLDAWYCLIFCPA